MYEQQFVIVSTSQRLSLVRLSDIREIVSLMALSQVDEQHGSCRGMANLRGEIIPVFDLTGPDAPLSPSRFILVSRAGEHPIGLIVDEIHDVVSVPADQIAERPSGNGHSSFVARLDGRLLSVLEPALALRRAV